MPQSEAVPGRRNFLAWATGILGGAAALALGIPLVGYLASVIWKPRHDEWIKLDQADSYALHETRLVKFDSPYREPWDGDAGRIAAYVRRQGQDEFLVFAVNCAHLGCPVSWFPQAGLFLCPCHGGVYYEDGAYASGPPPRGLYQYEWKVEKGGLWIKAGQLPTLEAPGLKVKQT